MSEHSGRSAARLSRSRRVGYHHVDDRIASRRICILGQIRIFRGPEILRREYLFVFVGNEEIGFAMIVSPEAALFHIAEPILRDEDLVKLTVLQPHRTGHRSAIDRDDGLPVMAVTHWPGKDLANSIVGGANRFGEEWEGRVLEKVQFGRGQRDAANVGLHTSRFDQTLQSLGVKTDRTAAQLFNRVRRRRNCVRRHCCRGR